MVKWYYLEGYTPVFLSIYGGRSIDPYTPSTTRSNVGLTQNYASLSHLETISEGLDQFFFPHFEHIPLPHPPPGGFLHSPGHLAIISP